MGSACCKSAEEDVAAPAPATAAVGTGDNATTVTRRSSARRAAGGAPRSGDSGRGAGNRGAPDISWRPTWKAEGQGMTMGQLMSKRDEFWDTAPAFDGRREIWQALRVACDEPVMAESVVEAANIKLPHGNLRVAYDELGNKYELPDFVLSEPVNLIVNGSFANGSPIIPASGTSGPAGAADPSTTAIGKPIDINMDGAVVDATTAGNTVVDGAPSVAAGGGGASDGFAAAEGKEPPTGDAFAMKVRLSTGEDLPWKGDSKTTIGQLKQQLYAAKKVAQGAGIRFFWGGRPLQDNATLASAKIEVGAVVQALVRAED